MSSDVVGSMVVVEGKADSEKPVDREKVRLFIYLLTIYAGIYFCFSNVCKGY